MIIGLKFRDELNALGSVIVDELDQLVAGIRGFWNIEHTETGAHSDITADSLTLTENSLTGATGDLSADGEGVFGGNVTAQLGTTDEVVLGGQPTGPVPDRSGIQLGGSSTGFFLGTTGAQSPGPGGDKELRLWQLNRSTFSVLRLVYDNANAWHLLGIESGAALAIGEDSNGKRISELNAHVVRAQAGYYERGRTTLLGEWISPSFSAANYTANSGSWTVDAGDKITLAYTVIGKTMIVAFTIANTDVSAAATQLRIAIPGGFTSNRRIDTQCTIQDAGATAVQGQCFVAAGGTTINIEKNGGVAFTITSLDNTNVTGTIAFEVQ